MHSSDLPHEESAYTNILTVCSSDIVKRSSSFVPVPSQECLGFLTASAMDELKMSHLLHNSGYLTRLSFKFTSDHVVPK